MLATLIQRYNKKNYFIYNLVQERETKWNFTGCQVLHFMIVLIPYTIYQFIKPFLDNNVFFEEYGALKKQQWINKQTDK